MNEKNLYFLADESCDFNIVRSLRSAGYDVVAIAELYPGISDKDVLRICNEQKRILLTEDKDFGEWIYAHGEESPGVTFIRFPASARSLLGKAIIQLVHKCGADLLGSFTVLEPGKIRIKKLT